MQALPQGIHRTNQKELNTREKEPFQNIMIKNMLKRRKESDTYLATVIRYCWSAQMTMKNFN